MRNTRLLEQKRAASRGNYAVVIWLDHASAEVKQAVYPPLASDLERSPVRGSGTAGLHPQSGGQA